MKKKLIKTALLFLSLFFAISPLETANSPAIENVPQSAEEVEVIEQKALQELAAFLEVYTTVEIRTFDNTITEWNQFRNRLISYNSLLITLGLSGADDTTIEAGKDSAIKLTSALIYDLHSQIFPIIIAYLEKTPFDTLTPAQKQIVYQQLLEIPSNTLPEKLKVKVEHFKQILSEYPREGFTLLRGNAQEKTSDENGFSVLNLNVCGFPDLLSMLYGGPRPWKERIDSLSGRLKAADADVICLQEVFDPELSAALYEKLKDQYAYFYVDIGPRVDIVGVSSGLFVASKYKIENPQFTLFTDREKVRGYGFFDFDIKTSTGVMGHITTTHLQPFQSEKDQEIRKNEMKQIVNSLKTLAKTKEIPFFFCGDLNIQWGFDEPSQQLLKDNFLDSYNKDRIRFTKDERTCLDFTDFWINGRKPDGFQKTYELIDYALLFKTDAAETYEVTTRRVPMGEVTAASVPDSDHDGLFSVVQKKQLS